MERGTNNGQPLDGVINMDKTKVASVGSASQSLRTVIPLWIAKLMRLKKGSIVEWNVIREEDTYSAHMRVVEEE